MGRIGSRRTLKIAEASAEILTKKRSASPSVAVAAFQEKKEEV